MTARLKRLAPWGILLAILAGWQGASLARPKDAPPAAPFAAAGTRFYFEVVESFDSKYLGDTPGHLGRSGGLEGVRPCVAWGDAVFRGEQKVGTITSVVWSRTQGSLSVEFDPLPTIRVSVGDDVWLDLNPQGRTDPVP